MRQYIENFRAPVPKIMFGGLDTLHSEVFTRDHMSPDLSNVDLRPVGGIRKRDGLSEPEHATATPNSIPGTGDVHSLFALNSMTSSFLYAIRGSGIYATGSQTAQWTELTDVGFAVGGKGRCEQAFFVDEVADSDVADEWVYQRACGYMVTGEDEPVLVFSSTVPGEEGVPWPNGVYDDVSTVAKRGYPARWKDATGLGTPDWPSGLFYAGDASLVTTPNNDASFTRMYAYGFDLDPDRIDYSQLGVPYNMLHASVVASPAPDVVQDGGFFYAMRGDGDRVVGVRQLSDTLVVFKRHKTLLYTGVIGVNFGLTGVLPVGAVSDESIVLAGNDIYFWSDDGPRSLSGVMQYGSVQQYSISRDVRETVARVSSSSFDLIHGRYETDFNRIVWHVGQAAGATIDRCLVYYLPDFDNKEGRWAPWTGLYSQMAGVTLVAPNNSPGISVFGATLDGRFFLMNAGTTDADENIAAHYVTRWMDFEVLSIDKRLLNISVVYGSEGRGGVVIEHAADYGELYKEVGHVLRFSGGNPAGSGLWDQAVWDDEDFYWDTTSNGVATYALENLGFIIRLKVSDDTSGGFSITGMALDVSYKGKV